MYLRMELKKAWDRDGSFYYLVLGLACIVGAIILEPHPGEFLVGFPFWVKAIFYACWYLLGVSGGILTLKAISTLLKFLPLYIGYREQRIHHTHREELGRTFVESASLFDKAIRREVAKKDCGEAKSFIQKARLFLLAANGDIRIVRAQLDASEKGSEFDVHIHEYSPNRLEVTWSNEKLNHQLSTKIIRKY